ncbi:tight adherence protein C [Paraburkholderia bannensis]|uniref:Tight adherence protein C n=1 Tax=Paraburkholderia bannensis TaxID=765414 RepID=A0A7W9WUQ5_9BURK|nr:MULTISPECIES: type II secretion system F family protein [Paraburkholderia]MBB3259575.1 tight adherence protein C [Paraburkholderia sp. WP4_3_2]MBB6104591.1 tight adherence protein C [Paraburkholderia bannensis]
MSPHGLGVFALLLAALGVGLLAALACQRLVAARKSTRTLEQAMARTVAQTVGASGTPGAAASALAGGQAGAGRSVPGGQAAQAANTGADTLPGARKRSGLQGMIDALGTKGVRWLDTPLGKLIVADEDRRLIEQCGYVDPRARGLYCIIRLASAFIVACLGMWYALANDSKPLVFGSIGLLLGFFIPKVFIGRRAHARLESVADELPMLVDLLRLLQGVGLSLDQSLQVLINEFRLVLPVLAGEMEIAQRQFVTGRTREQSLQRMSSIYENEDLRAVIRLLVQVDKHGGAVQEPLKQFGDRLRDVRRATLRERIGKLTVRMTGVMVVTLLPALLIVTAGPGIIAVLHSLSQIHR